MILTIPDWTSQQQTVIDLYLKDYTQIDIAHFLKVKQPTIHKVLAGNKVYEAGTGNFIRYGGVRKKIMTSCIVNKKFHNAVLKLYNIDECNRFLFIIRSWFKTHEDYVKWIESPISIKLQGKTIWVPQMIIDFNNGSKVPQLAEKYGCTPHQIYWQLQKNKISLKQKKTQKPRKADCLPEL